MEGLTSCGKKSFILYNEWSLIFNMLTDQQAGHLIKLIYAFVNDDTLPEYELLVKVAFEPIRQCIIRDQEKWALFRKKQAENGRKGGRPSNEKEGDQNPTLLDQNPENPPVNLETQKSLNVNVNANVNVNDNVKDNTHTKKERVRDFYRDQLALSKEDSDYKLIVQFLYGKNDTGEKLTHVLNIEQQLTYEQFKKLVAKCGSSKRSLREMLMSLNNDKKYYKDKASVYLTLNSWLNRSPANK